RLGALASELCVAGFRRFCLCRGSDSEHSDPASRYTGILLGAPDDPVRPAWYSTTYESLTTCHQRTRGRHPFPLAAASNPWRSDATRRGARATSLQANSTVQ